MLTEETPGVRALGSNQRLGRAVEDELAALGATFGPQIDDRVRFRDDVEIVDDDDCIPCIDERIQDTHELSDVRGVKAGRRLIEKVERAATRRLGKLIGKLDALCFAARQCVRGMSQR